MKILVLIWMLFGSAMSASVLFPLTSVVRIPEHDTAIVESSRINGNFAYSTMEGHAYKAITPIFGHIITPGALQPVNIVYMQN